MLSEATSSGRVVSMARSASWTGWRSLAPFWLSSGTTLLKVQDPRAALGETGDYLYPVVSSDTSYCRITRGCARSANVAVLQKCRTSGNADSALLPRGLLGPRTDLSKPVGPFPRFALRGSGVRVRALRLVEDHAPLVVTSLSGALFYALGQMWAFSNGPIRYRLSCISNASRISPSSVCW